MKYRFPKSPIDRQEPKGWPTNVMGDWMTYSAISEARHWFLPHIPSGILVAHNPTTPSPPASALLSALGKVKGLSFDDAPVSDVPAGTAWLMIAPKPSGLRSIIPRAFRPSIDALNNLAKFAWTNTIIVYDPRDSFDAGILSGQIASVLNGVKALNTNLPAWMLHEMGFREGVTIAATPSSSAAIRAGYTQDSKWIRWREIDDQRTALIGELGKAGIVAEMGWLSSSAPFGWIVVKIGSSPGRETLRRYEETQFEETRRFHPTNR